MFIVCHYRMQKITNTLALSGKLFKSSINLIKFITNSDAISSHDDTMGPLGH